MGILGPWNVWEAISGAVEDYTRRARGEVELTYSRQAAEVLAPYLSSSRTLLDAACATGHLYHAFRRRGVDAEYFGIDISPRLIDIGRAELVRFDLPPDHLSVRDIAQIDRTYDIVVCLNTLCFLPNYHVYLDRLCQAAERVLLIRASLSDATTIQYVTDGAVDPPYEDMKLYFNTYSLSEVSSFIAERGFAVTRVKDEHTQDGPETVVGRTLYRKLLLCVRQPARRSA